MLSSGLPEFLDDADEIAALRTLLRRVQKSPQAWARLSYPERADYWSVDERGVLERAGIVKKVRDTA